MSVIDNQGFESGTNERPIRLPRYYGVIVLFWTVLIGTILVIFNWFIVESYSSILHSKVRSADHRIHRFLDWYNSNSDLYIPLSAAGDHNHNIPGFDRRATTTDGKELVASNPAWLIQRVGRSDSPYLSQVKTEMTSLKLIDESNAPDEWEEKILKQWDSLPPEYIRDAEHTELVRLRNGRTCMRLARPLFMEESCVQCHEIQGYEIGDFRGIVSTQMPAHRVLAVRNDFLFWINFCGVAVWCFGMVGLTYMRKRINETHQILADNHDRLEQVVELRTRELQESVEVARLAKMEADNASIAKTKYLAHMSHEIRTPLNGVIGLSRLLDDTTLTPKQSHYLSMINLSGKSLLSLINDILDFSKIEAGKFELNCAKFDLHRKLQSVFHILSTQGATRKLELCTDIDPAIPQYVYGDADRLLQIFINFAGNSIKFTEQGGVRISALLDKMDNKHICVHFSIQDTGIGVPPEKLARLFDPYTQADASTASHYGGTGLGLPIAESLVRMMGGEVKVETQVGVGTRFSFTISFGSVKEQNLNSRESMFSLEGIRVLVVDDNPLLCDSLTAQLRGWKMCPEFLRDPQHVVDYLKKAKRQDIAVRLLIVDEEFDGTTGEYLLEQIERDAELAHPPAILLLPASKINDDPSREKSRWNTVVKPISVSALYDAIISTLFGDNATKYFEKRQEAKQQNKFIAAQSRGVKILVAEDNTVNQIVIGEMLKANGYEIDIVSNGREAVDSVKSRSYDAVLMDCQMPEMDGYEATRILRKEEGERLPIIALTANANADDCRKCLDAGMDAYCGKPIDPAVLFGTLDRVLASKK